MAEIAVPQWGRFEHLLASNVTYANAIQDATLHADLVSPSGRSVSVDGFWNGDTEWRVRLCPDEIGPWSFSTICSDTTNTGLHHQSGAFICVPSIGPTRFDQHGAICVSANRRFLVHADGTPFFWMADTAWNGPLLSTDEEWEVYIQERVRQKFTAVQWVATQWIASPTGDRDNRLALFGKNSISINPAFFQRMDTKLDALNRAGLVAAPVSLWAASWGDNPAMMAINPGLSLPEDQAILLARYMVARWGANHIVWILNGDGDYRGLQATRWRNIGRAVFGEGAHAPVALHPGGRLWVQDEFAAETWVDIIGYQSGHSADEQSLRWLVQGPPATDWEKEPPRLIVNLEPPYENHNEMSNPGKRRLDASNIRRALYSSLLVAPTAGVSYGGHGIWGWDDGTVPPVAHPNTGTPLPWFEALRMLAAEQIAHLMNLFNSIEWWRLVPAPDLVAVQPGDMESGRFIAASATKERDLIIIYVPQEPTLKIHKAQLRPGLTAEWFDPRTGAYLSTQAYITDNEYHYSPPTDGDWILILKPR